MSSQRQAEANRQNAQKSTGPKTEAGKDRSRRNALKDGLTGEGTVLTASQEDAVACRMESWRNDFQLQGEHQAWVFRELILSTVRLDQIEVEERNIRTQLAARACQSWDVDRLLETEKLGARLAARPAIVQLELLATAQGCQWLIDRWNVLIAALEPAPDADASDAPRSWTEEQETHALDLCGLDPVLRIAGRRAWELTDYASALDLARSERDDLICRHERLLELDQHSRELAESGLPPFNSPADRAIWRIRRLEQACWRTYHWARKQLAESPRSMPTAPPAPVPTPPPAPTPAPAPPPAPEKKRTQCDSGEFMKSDLVASLFPPSSSRLNVPVKALGNVLPVSIVGSRT